MQPAPLFNDIARGPEGGQAYWLTTTDNVRLRAGHWGADPSAPSRGTVLLFPGRTEYIEKYGVIASELAALGFHTLTVDWRGQGLADRPDKARELGHVGHFDEYQNDVRSLVDLAHNLNLPQPWKLLGHSMGGCIGLRALHEGLAVKSATFTAPMWGISMARQLRPLAWSMSWALHKSPLNMMLSPGTKRETYLAWAPFEDNFLTTDPAMFRYMTDQAQAQPDLTLGGPTVGWLYAALVETRALMKMAPPATPCTSFLGTRERIVQSAPIHRYMSRWSNGDLIIVDGAEHEVLMEAKPIRQRAYDVLISGNEASSI